MAKRDPYRIENIGELSFRVTDFDAFSGGAAFLFCLKKLIPLIKALNIDLTKLMGKDAEKGLAEIVDMVAPVVESITQENLKEFMELCLAQVEQQFPAGWVKVYNNGIFQSDDVKYSPKLAMLLCYHAVKGIITDFFGESGSNLFPKLKAIMNP